MARTSFIPGVGVVAETSTTRTSFVPGAGVVAETSANAPAAPSIAARPPALRQPLIRH